MLRFIGRLLGAAAVATLWASAALAGPIPVGYVSWDLNIPGSVGNFDIANFTGTNALAPDFPITTSLSLSGLSLTVNFAGGGSTVFGSSYFTLGLDGLSFNGGDIPIGGANPLPIDATLTGAFSTTSISLAGGGSETILSTFSAFISPNPGSSTLLGGEFALINAQPAGGGAVPEPDSLLLVGTGLLAAMWRPRRGAR